MIGNCWLISNGIGCVFSLNCCYFQTHFNYFRFRISFMEKINPNRIVHSLENIVNIM